MSLRYFNVAGATETLGEDHDPETHLIPNVLRGRRGAAEPLTDLRRRLPDPRRHVHPRLHPRRRPRRRAPARARGDRARRSADRPARSSQPGQRRRLLASARSSPPPRRVVGRPIPSPIGARRAGDPPVLVARADRRPRSSAGDAARDPSSTRSSARPGHGASATRRLPGLSADRPRASAAPVGRGPPARAARAARSDPSRPAAPPRPTRPSRRAPARSATAR